MKIGFISLGCSKNLVDSEKMMGMITSGQHELVANAQEAEAIIINTCGFINSAKEEAINTIF
ncbi:MAG: 30S ribosomal protein S12 methylthiotransferase RimO, partial [Longicatena sp.]